MSVTDTSNNKSPVSELLQALDNTLYDPAAPAYIPVPLPPQPPFVYPHWPYPMPYPMPPPPPFHLMPPPPPPSSSSTGTLSLTTHTHTHTLRVGEESTRKGTKRKEEEEKEYDKVYQEKKMRLDALDMAYQKRTRELIDVEAEIRARERLIVKRLEEEKANRDREQAREEREKQRAEERKREAAEQEEKKRKEDGRIRSLTWKKKEEKNHDDDRMRERKRESTPQCSYWTRSSGCWSGDKCPFSHEGGISVSFFSFFLSAVREMCVQRDDMEANGKGWFTRITLRPHHHRKMKFHWCQHIR